MPIADQLHNFLSNFAQSQGKNFQNLSQFNLFGPQGVAEANENDRQKAALLQAMNLHNSLSADQAAQLAMTGSQQAEGRQLNLLNLLKGEDGSVAKTPDGATPDATYAGQNFSVTPSPRFTISKDSPLGKAMGVEEDLKNIPQNDFLKYSSQYAEHTAGKQKDQRNMDLVAQQLGIGHKQIDSRFTPDYYKGMYGGAVDPSMEDNRKTMHAQLELAGEKDKSTGNSTQVQQVMKEILGYESPWEKMMKARQTRADQKADREATAGVARSNHEADFQAGREDRSYQYHMSELDKMAKPVADAAARFSRLTDTVNAKTPQADALVAPELLTIMAGGQGSGLRMNEAEIARIFGARTNWESIKTAVNKWQLDPSKGLQINDPQRAQIRQLIGAVGQRLQKKNETLTNARTRLAQSSSVGEHRQIMDEANRSVNGIDIPSAATPQSQLGLAGAEPDWITVNGRAVKNPNKK